MTRLSHWWLFCLALLIGAALLFAEVFRQMRALSDMLRDGV